jgi:anthraniloyl-CoA monooxygenase
MKTGIRKRVVFLGGGPADLPFAISMKLRDPAHDVTVIERNRADDAFGWRMVPSDDALENMAEIDPVSARAIHDRFAYWDDVAVVQKGIRNTSGCMGSPGSGGGSCGSRCRGAPAPSA